MTNKLHQKNHLAPIHSYEALRMTESQFHFGLKILHICMHNIDFFFYWVLHGIIVISLMKVKYTVLCILPLLSHFPIFFFFAVVIHLVGVFLVHCL